MKELVAFFSPTGTTKKLALELAKKKNADIFEIEAKVPYTNADLDWMDSNSKTSVEMREKTARPEMKEGNPHIENYDRIYLGFPIWWYVAPMIIHTFLEKYDFSNKEVICFATSGSSGFGDTLKYLKESVDKSCKIKVTKVNNISGI